MERTVPRTRASGAGAGGAALGGASGMPQAAMANALFMVKSSSDIDVDRFDDVAGVAAAVPLGLNLGLAGGVGGAGQEAILAARGLPGQPPAPPGVVAKVGIEFGGRPGL